MSDVLSYAPGEVTLRRLLAPLRAALDHPDTREVVVNRPGEFGVENSQGWSWHENPELDFKRCEALARLAGRLTHQDLSPTTPACSSRLPDGERITIALPPISPPGTVGMTIRKRAMSFTPTLDWLRDNGWFSFLKNNAFQPPGGDWVGWLRQQVHNKANIAFTGATGSSKTTAAEACIREFGEDERFTTLESTPEFHIKHRNWVPRLYAQEPGRGLLTAEQTLELALRERPDRIVFGELRTSEAWGLMRALMSGHDGTITTAHADPGIEAFVNTVYLMASQSVHTNGVPEATIKGLLRQHFRVVIHCAKVRGNNDGVPYRATSIEVAE